MLGMTMYSSPKENKLHFQQQIYILQSETPMPKIRLNFHASPIYIQHMQSLAYTKNAWSQGS